VDNVVTEVASSINESRPKLVALLEDQGITLLPSACWRLGKKYQGAVGVSSTCAAVETETLISLHKGHIFTF
jgi:hypothetical protein